MPEFSLVVTFLNFVITKLKTGMMIIKGMEKNYKEVAEEVDGWIEAMKVGDIVNSYVGMISKISLKSWDK
jgi:hypothetical protein